MAQKCRFSQDRIWLGERPEWLRGPGAATAFWALLGPALDQTDQFIKTGSGQTQERAEDRGVFCHGVQALLCKVLSKLTIARLRSSEPGGKQQIEPNSWAKLGTVCARANQVMEQEQERGGGGGGGGGGLPPAALVAEVKQNLGAVSGHADDLTVALMNRCAKKQKSKKDAFFSNTNWDGTGLTWLALGRRRH